MSEQTKENLTREKIIEIIKDNLQYECYNGFGISEYSINTAEIYDKADTLFVKIEQEKKEMVGKILNHITEIARDKGIKLPIEMLDAFVIK